MKIDKIRTVYRATFFLIVILMLNVITASIIYYMHRDSIPPEKYSIPVYSYFFRQYDLYNIKKQIKANPYAGNLQVKLAEIFLSLNDMENYKESIDKAVALDPAITFFYNDVLGWKKYESGKLKEAIWYFKLARDLDKNGASLIDLHIAIASTYKELGDQAKDDNIRLSYYQSSLKESRSAMELLEKNPLELRETKRDPNKKEIFKKILKIEIEYLEKKMRK